jgi:hypothetical protein
MVWKMIHSDVKELNWKVHKSVGIGLCEYLYFIDFLGDRRKYIEIK